MGQKPITFIRQVRLQTKSNRSLPQRIGNYDQFLLQVLTLVTSPELLNSPEYPSDVKERAQTILDNCQGNSIGKS